MTAAPSPSKALRQIFLAVFLRGRAARTLQKQGAPKSIGVKLVWTLVFYAAFGCFSVFFMRQSLFALSLYLHASTLMFIGMFVLTSGGEALFNKEEADILLHRPVTPRALLWAKVSVMTEISLWLAGAFNLVGFFIGANNVGPMFLLAHAISTVLQALFCIGLVVVSYQLCLRWFGRERLDGLITTMQTVMSVVIVLGSQLAPRFIMNQGGWKGGSIDSWWLFALPPAWFAGLDEALVGIGGRGSWTMAAMAVVSTAIVLWAGLGKLARDYGAGLQMLQENQTSKPGQAARKRWLERFVQTPIMRWWLKDSVARASFLLSTAYLLRDRDVKLRVYPGLAPMLMMPIIFLMPNRGTLMMGEFGTAFAGAYLGLLPMMGLSLLKYSQQWQAADIFHAVPLRGPGLLCEGARKATLFVIALPLLLVLTAAVVIVGIKAVSLKMLLPGLITIPIFSIIPSLSGDAIPLSQPPEEAKQAGRGLQMIGVMFGAMAIAGLAMAANAIGYFWVFLLVEAIAAAFVFKLMSARIANSPWPSQD